MEENGSGNDKRKDYFWLVIIAGVVVVTAGALFTGNYLARAFLSGDEQSEVVVSDVVPEDSESIELVLPTDINIDNETPEKDADGPTTPAPAADAPVKEKPKPEKTVAAEKPKPVVKTKPVKPAVPVKVANQEPKSEIAITGIKKTEKPQEPENTAAEVPVSDDTTAADEENPTDDNMVPATSSVIHVLQLGVYGNKDNALRMKTELEDEFELDVYVAEVTIEDEVKYRVQAGAFSNKENAEKLGRELQIKGYKFYISEQPAPE